MAIDLSHWPNDKYWDYVLIIPVCGESKDFLTRLMQHQQPHKVLLIVTVNRPKDHAKSTQWHAENISLMQHISISFNQQILLSEGHQLLTDNRMSNSSYDVLLLNFNQQAFDPKKGVGLARRISADTALSLFERKVIKTPWIFSTDADVVLPAGYFDVVDEAPTEATALSLNFKHVTSNVHLQYLQSLYDFKLKYYQLGVRYMGADYDYIPLGSSLVIDMESYAKVRGFPCKSGGEDFYVLNKLAKLGCIYKPVLPIIEIDSRYSERVPFGTGPAVKHINQQQLEGQAYEYYHPKIFHILKAWRNDLNAYYDEQKYPVDSHGLNQCWQIEHVLRQAISQINSKHRWHQFVHEWFDAFKILKSVHFLRQHFKSMGLEELQQSTAYKDIVQ